MSQFHSLIVTDIYKTIRDAVVVTLMPEKAKDFNFTQGQYLTFRKNFDGEELRRSYSICAGKEDGVLQVGIKRVNGGVFSTWANTELAVGETIEAMPPMGNFYSQTNFDNPHYLAFARGSGITPVLSILKTTLFEDTTARLTLVYANINPNTIMFREELEDLKNQHMERLNIIHILDDEVQDIDLFQGPLDAAKCTCLFESWIDIDHISTAYICGPEAMMKIIASSLQEHGLAKENIRFELFASEQPGRAKTPAQSMKIAREGVDGRVTIGGETRSLNIEPQTSLLDAALKNTLDAPYACKAGICSSCKAKVLQGDVEMIANHALEDHEVEAGYVLTCQCYPVSSEKVIWDYDQARH